MALEAVVFPEGLFTRAMKACSFNFVESGLKEEDNINSHGVCLDGVCENWEASCSTMVEEYAHEETGIKAGGGGISAPGEEAAAAAASGRRKRRRSKSVKNKEEVENQRMTHIAVERNRRKLMNEYLAVLRSLMPASYAQRGDQASIVGGAINFVKELEQLLQSLEAHKRIKQQRLTSFPPFSSFFSFPQYSSSIYPIQNDELTNHGISGECVADIEVTMVESHANLRVRSKRRPKQLLSMLMGFQGLRLTALHLNMTTTKDQMVLYSFNLKVEDDCRLTTVDEIATAVHQMVETINKESTCI